MMSEWWAALLWFLLGVGICTVSILVFHLWRLIVGRREKARKKRSGLSRLLDNERVYKWKREWLCSTCKYNTLERCENKRARAEHRVCSFYVEGEEKVKPKRAWITREGDKFRLFVGTAPPTWRTDAYTHPREKRWSDTYCGSPQAWLCLHKVDFCVEDFPPDSSLHSLEQNGIAEIEWAIGTKENKMMWKFGVGDTVAPRRNPQGRRFTVITQYTPNCGSQYERVLSYRLEDCVGGHTVYWREDDLALVSKRREEMKPKFEVGDIVRSIDGREHEIGAVKMQYIAKDPRGGLSNGWWADESSLVLVSKEKKMKHKFDVGDIVVGPSGAMLKIKTVRAYPTYTLERLVGGEGLGEYTEDELTLAPNKHKFNVGDVVWTNYCEGVVTVVDPSHYQVKLKSGRTVGRVESRLADTPPKKRAWVTRGPLKAFSLFIGTQPPTSPDCTLHDWWETYNADSRDCTCKRVFEFSEDDIDILLPDSVRGLMSGYLMEIELPINIRPVKRNR